MLPIHFNGLSAVVIHLCSCLMIITLCMSSMYTQLQSFFYSLVLCILCNKSALSPPPPPPPPPKNTHSQSTRKNTPRASRTSFPASLGPGAGDHWSVRIGPCRAPEAAQCDRGQLPSWLRASSGDCCLVRIGPSRTPGDGRTQLAAQPAQSQPPETIGQSGSDFQGLCEAVSLLFLQAGRAQEKAGGCGCTWIRREVFGVGGSVL